MFVQLHWTGYLQVYRVTEYLFINFINNDDDDGDYGLADELIYSPQHTFP